MFFPQIKVIIIINMYVYLLNWNVINIASQPFTFYNISSHPDLLITLLNAATASFSSTLKSQASSQKNGIVLVLAISMAAANVHSVNQNLKNFLLFY
jgi:hypothetical protein